MSKRKKHLNFPQAGHPEAMRGPEQPYPQGVYLENPDAAPAILKNVPQDCETRQNGLGFAQRPTNINDIAPGDAGAGRSQFRRAQFFTRIAGTADGPNASAFVYDNPRGLATARSLDTRPRFWHVSFFNQGVVRTAAGPLAPLTEQQINDQTARVPSLAMTRGRIQVHDESGSRFFDVDILGSRSLQVYAFGVTVFILTPRLEVDGAFVDQGYEVDSQNPDSNPALDAGLVEDSLCAARIIPSFQNATQIQDNITRTVSVPVGGEGVIEVPPGARTVQLRTAFTPAASIPAGYIITFAVRDTFLPSPNVISLGEISLIPGTAQTDILKIPNAKYILFSDPGGGASAIPWIATFEVEA